MENIESGIPTNDQLGPINNEIGDIKEEPKEEIRKIPEASRAGISRRSFLKAAGATVAGMMVPGIESNVLAADENSNESEADRKIRLFQNFTATGAMLGNIERALEKIDVPAGMKLYLEESLAEFKEQYAKGYTNLSAGQAEDFKNRLQKNLKSIFGDNLAPLDANNFKENITSWMLRRESENAVNHASFLNKILEKEASTHKLKNDRLEKVIKELNELDITKIADEQFKTITEKYQFQITREQFEKSIKKYIDEKVEFWSGLKKLNSKK